MQFSTMWDLITIGMVMLLVLEPTHGFQEVSKGQRTKPVSRLETTERTERCEDDPGYDCTNDKIMEDCIDNKHGIKRYCKKTCGLCAKPWQGPFEALSKGMENLNGVVTNMISVVRGNLFTIAGLTKSVENINKFLTKKFAKKKACPCKNGGQCITGVDLDANGQEDCDCSSAIGFEGITCEDATGSRLLIHTYIHI